MGDGCQVGVFSGSRVVVTQPLGLGLGLEDVSPLIRKASSVLKELGESRVGAKRL